MTRLLPDNRLDMISHGRYCHHMKSIDISAAQSRLPEICNQIVSSGESVIVTSQDDPLVKIVPATVSSDALSIWEAARVYRDRTSVNDDLVLPPRTT